MKILPLILLLIAAIFMVARQSGTAYILVTGTGIGGNTIAPTVQAALAKYHDQTDLANCMANASAFSSNAVTAALTLWT